MLPIQSVLFVRFSIMQSLKDIWRSLKKDAATARGSSTKPGGKLGVEQQLDQFEEAFQNLDEFEVHNLGNQIISKLNLLRSNFHRGDHIQEIQFEEDINSFCNLIRKLCDSFDGARGLLSELENPPEYALGYIAKYAWCQHVLEAQNDKLQEYESVPVPQGVIAAMSHRRKISRLRQSIFAYEATIANLNEKIMTLD